MAEAFIALSLVSFCPRGARRAPCDCGVDPGPRQSGGDAFVECPCVLGQGGVGIPGREILATQ